MRRGWWCGVVAAAVLVVGGCGSQESSEGPEIDPGSATTPAPGVALPRTGTIGDLPPEESRAVVTVDAEGTIHVDGMTVDWTGLRRHLAARADVDREDGPARLSALHLVLRLDASLPWRVAQWLMQIGAEADLRVYRVFFAVLPEEEGEEEGALAVYLPMDRGLPRNIYGSPVTPFVRVKITASGGGVDGEALAHRLFGVSRIEQTPALLEADGRVPFGTVLTALDALYRARIEQVTFQGTENPTGSSPLGTAITAARTRPADPGLEALGFAVRAGTGEGFPLREGIRVRGGFAGTTDVRYMPGREIKIDPDLFEEIPEVVPEEIVPHEVVPDETEPIEDR